MNSLILLAAAGALASDAVPTVLLALAFAIVGAKLAGELVERLGQPAVLGELVFGVAVGNASGFAVLLTAAAILGKLACGLVAPPGVSRLTLGFGMMPRGEVGLIFAAIGAQLVFSGRPVIDAGAYAAAVFMVLATTMLTPPLLVWSIRRP